MIVSPQENPQESHVYESPDRSLSVEAAASQQQTSGPGITVGRDIHIDFSQLKEMYGSDIQNLLNVNLSQDAAAQKSEPGWHPIRLRFLGTGSADFCEFANCGRPVAAQGSFTCSRCEGTMCRRHQDEDKSSCCKVCEKRWRAEEFDNAAQQVGAGLGW